MSRTARIKSESGIYHIMLRGIDKRDLFLNNSDYETFIYHMKKAKEKSDYAIYAYCLMTNHIHILMRPRIEEIGDIIRRIAVGYALYHNFHNGRTGHLFQNRFKSEAVESDEYFLTALRYIHQNPVKAGLANSPKDYKWSSYNEYLNEEKFFIDTKFALSYFSNIDEFKNFNDTNNDDDCMEDSRNIRWTDDELVIFINSITNINKLCELDIKTRNDIIKNIKEKVLVSNRQLSRVLNIGRSIIDKIK